MALYAFSGFGSCGAGGAAVSEMVVLEHRHHRQATQEKGKIVFSGQTQKSILKALWTKKSPYYIQFYITGRCNLMCRQCNIVETNSRVKEMGLDEIRRVAQNLRRIGAGIVLLTGGEPFIRKDLPEIVDIFVKNKLNVRLQTAGTRFATEEALRACYDAGARDINVSLDSLDFNKFDYINAVPGSAKSAIETIERISKVFRHDSAILSFGTVMSRFNYMEVPAIVEFAKRIGWYVSIVPVHIAHPAMPKGFRSYDNDFSFHEPDWPEMDRMVRHLIEMKRDGFPIFDAEKFLLSSASFLKGNGPTWRHKGVCDSPNLYFAIRPNGAFTTCCDYTLENPPYTYEDSFVQDYLQGHVEDREDVQKIVKNCSGCHYGSYPEVTLSVRDLRAFVERIFLVLESSQGQLADAEVKSDFVAELDKVKALYSKVYPLEQWMDQTLLDRVRRWADAESRQQVLLQDSQRRKEQNRQRGVGPDVIIGPEPIPVAKGI